MRVGRLSHDRFYDENAGAGAGAGVVTPPAGDGGKDAEYWKGEARKAFTDRDTTKAKLRELEARVLSDEDRALFDQLKAQAATSEEQRKRKEGEFDAWRSDITKKHDEALTGEKKRAEAAEAKLRQKLIGLEFANALSLFGADGKTVLTPDIAEAYLGKYVEIQEIDGKEVVVVKGLDGHVILNAKTGKPAAFLEAMTEVIDGLPNKAQILRGSGKAGSGSPGGATGKAGTIDTSRLVARDFRDAAVREAVRQQQNVAGGLQFGPAFDRAAAAKK